MAKSAIRRRSPTAVTGYVTVTDEEPIDDRLPGLLRLADRVDGRARAGSPYLAPLVHFRSHLSSQCRVSRLATGPPRLVEATLVHHDRARRRRHEIDLR